jgi:hypothetical protein
MWLLLAFPFARADERLVTDHVAVGVASDGSFGLPSLGLVADPDGPAGPFPSGGDVLRAGRMFEAWVLESGEQYWIQGGSTVGSDLLLEWDAPTDDGALVVLRGTAEDAAIDVTARVVLPWGEPLIFTVLEVTAREALPALTAVRVVDPDLDAWVTGSVQTYNAAEADIAVASGDSDGRAWAVGAAGGLAGTCAWCTSAASLVAQAEPTYGDGQIGVGVSLGDLAAGDTARVVFVYAFGTDIEAARALAREVIDAEDLDRDGALAGEDCDDLDAWVGPWAAEEPNGVDDDCDGRIDEAADGAEDTGSHARDDWDAAIPEAEAPAETAGGCASAPLPHRRSAWLGAVAAAAIATGRRRPRAKAESDGSWGGRGPAPSRNALPGAASGGPR